MSDTRPKPSSQASAAAAAVSIDRADVKIDDNRIFPRAYLNDLATDLCNQIDPNLKKLMAQKTRTKIKKTPDIQIKQMKEEAAKLSETVQTTRQTIAKLELQKKAAKSAAALEKIESELRMQNNFLSKRITLLAKTQKLIAVYESQDEKIENSQNKKYDPLIFMKYGVKKYLLKNKEQNPTEAWVFDENSWQTPILEDQALKRVESFFVAAEAIFNRINKDDVRAAKLSALKIIYDAVKLKIENYYHQKNLSYKDLYSAIKKDIKHFLNDLAYIQFNVPIVTQKIDPKAVKHFHKNFWHYVEKTVPLFKRSDVFAVNLANNAMQYCMRGTNTVPKAVVDAKESVASSGGIMHKLQQLPVHKREFLSAHDRSDIGVSNFVFEGRGSITGETSHSDYRMASLSPIDLYKDEHNPHRLNTLAITFGSMKSLWEEMLSHNFKNVAYAQKNKTTNWINMSLLTVDQPQDKEDQGRQYRETILAADLLQASSNNRFNAIPFGFGVNWASRNNPFVPAIQQFENQRAFAKFLRLAIDSAYDVCKDNVEKGDDTQKALFTIISYFKTLTSAFLAKMGAIENSIRKAAEGFNRVFELYQKTPTHENLQLFEASKAAFVQMKESHYKAATEAFNDYSKNFLATRNDMLAKLNSLETENPVQKTLMHLCEDLFVAHDFYLNNKWGKEDAFILQASIRDGAQQIARLEEATMNNNSCTVTTTHCKSGNDRTTVEVAREDGLRAQRETPLEHDPKTHFAFSAMVQIPLIDTGGGGPKFNDKGVGLPNETYSDLLESSEGLATHKQEKHAFEVPAKLHFFIPKAIPLKALPPSARQEGPGDAHHAAGKALKDIAPPTPSPGKENVASPDPRAPARRTLSGKGS